MPIDNDRDNDQLILRRRSSPVGWPHRQQRSEQRCQNLKKEMVWREEQPVRQHLAQLHLLFFLFF
jgi:hypothetical protein